MTATIRIIRPAGREKNPNYLRKAILHLESEGFKVLFQDRPADPSWPFTSASIEERVRELNQAAAESESDIILCARGGYGCSELLSRIEFDQFKHKKLMLGFSDISVLLIAFYQKLQWPVLHCHMPATRFWNPQDPSIVTLVQKIKAISNAGFCQGSIEIESLPDSTLTLPIESGPLVGGNLSVLTNVLGTGFFEPQVSPSFLFLEDINETPPVVLRQVMQWKLAGYLEHISAIILGRFNFDDDKAEPIEKLLANQIEKKVQVKVFLSEDFGHVQSNYPIAVGGNAIIENNRLKWNLRS